MVWNSCHCGLSRSSVSANSSSSSSLSSSSSTNAAVCAINDCAMVRLPLLLLVEGAVVAILGVLLPSPVSCRFAAAVIIFFKSLASL